MLMSECIVFLYRYYTIPEPNVNKLTRYQVFSDSSKTEVVSKFAPEKA